MGTFSPEITWDTRFRAPRYTDGCPVCVTRYVRPVTVEATKGGVRAWYRHQPCGHRWYTSWGA